MFREKDATKSQLSLSNPYVGLTPEKQQKLKESWAGRFYEEVYCKIDESKFEVLYSNIGSRPNVPVRTLMSALCLKELYQLNDEELIEQIEWNRQFQAALGCSDDQPPFSARTLTRFRTKLFKYEERTGEDLVHEAIREQLDHFCKIMGTDRTVRRMDSFQISSNIKKLSRLELIYETNRVCIKALDKKQTALPSFLEHYLKDYDYNQTFYYSKELSYEQKTILLISETQETLRLLQSSKDCQEELELLERLISDHMIEEEGRLRLKKDKSEGLASSGLQSPHDPDATFREKKGGHKGYCANVEESACEDGSMIEDYQYEQNIYSDSMFMQDCIEKEEFHPVENPLMIISDGAYSSTDNLKKAEQKGIEHVPTELSGRKTNDICADFVLNDEGTEVLECPNGQKPNKCSYYEKTGQIRAVFDLKTCKKCPYFHKCHPKKQKKTTYKTISFKSVTRARIKRTQSGEKFNKCRNFRNGSEAVPSVMRSKFNVDRMPIRGLIRTRHLFGFKIGALAFKKYLRFRDRQAKRLNSCA